MLISTISVFPEMFSALEYGIPQRAIDKGLLNLVHLQLRDFTTDKHQTVDDRPYGGGPGMVMTVPPLQKAVHAAVAAANTPAMVVYLSPQGERFNQELAQRSTEYAHLILVAGRYEGVDERFIATEVDAEWSIGDYVLSGGELGAMVVIDAIARLLPGALGHSDSASQDSFSDGLLDTPHYTRPEEIAGLRVPDVLLKGNHTAIAHWRLQQALGRTWLRRPDLLAKRQLSALEQKLLNEFIEVTGNNDEQFNSTD
ncbi:MAG: tRNA (guanosine(37)-N1)-methyltransferase TrmD [Pseudomonadota bacterium]|nr:tRNA (guanosine(37)-N1)-methyltransferase TrmD [Pseudomonadota bacterium]